MVSFSINLLKELCPRDGPGGGGGGDGLGMAVVAVLGCGKIGDVGTLAEAAGSGSPPLPSCMFLRGPR